MTSLNKMIILFIPIHDNIFELVNLDYLPHANFLHILKFYKKMYIFLPLSINSHQI